MKAEIIQVLASFVGSFGFAVLYNLRGKKLCMAGISGMVSWIAYLIAWNEMPSTFVANLAAAAGASSVTSLDASEIIVPPPVKINGLFASLIICTAVAMSSSLMVSVFGVISAWWM